MIPALEQRGGFLALDKNGGARTTDGTELFGPTSGYGLAEPAAYDSGCAPGLHAEGSRAEQMHPLRVETDWGPHPLVQGNIARVAQLGDQ